MGKLYEIIAVEDDLRKSFQNILKETMTTFNKKTHLFAGQIRTLVMFDSTHPLHDSVDQQEELNETVPSKLDYMFSHVKKYLDVNLQKETSNQNAKGTFEVNGEIIAKDVPVTFLLGLESKLVAIRNVLKEIPTLQPGKKWVADKIRGKNIWTLDEQEVSYKGEKIVEPVVLYPHTDKHPAQVKESTKTIEIGKYYFDRWSGLITPAQKSMLMERVDDMIMAVKQSRQKANDIEASEEVIGDKIVKYLMADFI